MRFGYSDRNSSAVDIFHKDYTWTQDANGTSYISSVLTTTDPGQSYAAQSQTVQTLDAYGNLTQSKAYDYGNLTTPARTYNYTYLTDANYTSRYIRNRLTLATVTTASGTLTLTSKSYDSTVCGALQDPPGAPGSIPFHDANYSTSFTYRGNPTYVTNLGTSACAAYQTTGVTYQAQNGVGTLIATAPSASTGYSLPGVVTPNGNGNLATSVSYANSWAVTSVTGPNGASATTTYDSYGRPLQSTIPDGAVTNYSYTYNPNTQTATLGSRWTKTTLDGFGRVISVVKGHDSTPVSEVDTRYAPCACSPLGKMSQVSEPYAPGGTVYWTTYTYDASGRTLTVTAPDGSITTTSYSGNITQVWDAASKWKNYTKDSFGNLINVLEPDTPHGYNNSTTYTYNGVNQLTHVTMQTASGTQTRTFTWNGADLVSTANPENGTVNYTYDGAHHVLTRTDAKNQQTQYTYDIYGRLTNIYHFPQAPAYAGDPNHPADPSQQVTYYYDSNPFDGIFSTNSWGRLAAVAFGNACPAGSSAATVGYTYMYGYTTAGRVSAQRMRTTVNESIAWNWSCNPITVDQNASYGWDSEGRMTSMTYPGGVASYQYQYDVMGHLSGMTDSLHSNATVATASYGPAGEVDSLVHGGVNENFSYNSMWQLTGDAAMIYTYTAGQNNGRITQSTDRASGEVVNYTYDSLNRLASAQATNGSWGNAYSYDGFGNLTAKTVTAGSAPNFAASYNPATNQQNGLNYDANGNVAMPNGSAPYDVENRLLYSADGAYAFGYDPQGKRVLRQTASGTYPGPLTYSSEFSFYGITGQLLATFVIWSTTDSTQSIYPYQAMPAALKNVYFGGRLILESGMAVVTDRLGSVRTGASYYPWGEDRGSAANQQIKFGTYFRDLPGEDYADQRYYNSNAGRFYTPDSTTGNLVNPSSWNKYAYTNGDPVNFNDSHGRYACIVGVGENAEVTECEDVSVNVPGSNPNLGCATVTSPDDPTWQQCFGLPSSTQGTGTSKQIKVSNYQTTSPKATGVQNALRWIQSELPNDATCDSWLHNNSFVIDLVLGNNPDVKFQTGVGDFSDPTVNAVFGNTGTNLGLNAGITVNANGAYFSSSVTVGVGVTGITGGTAAAQVFILLHELAHATGAAGFLDNDSDPTRQAANNALVLQNCQKSIDFFGKP